MIPLFLSLFALLVAWAVWPRADLTGSAADIGAARSSRPFTMGQAAALTLFSLAVSGSFIAWVLLK